ncbi:MAG TPA: hypothetical protein VHV28_03110 [Solirubrobacteraceae bacterium]|jgi:hypothetical protein|nr:hypothetical protein [Solirubrobacteraceae bacterium]
MADLVTVKWYATVFRKDVFAADVGRVARLALRYGATQYAVHVDNDDRYRVTQMTWIGSKTEWYRYWDGPEMIEFRARNMGRFQVPIPYSWADEIAAGSLGPEVPIAEPNGAPEGSPAPAPAPATPQAA